jgi:hypothetical protein
MTTLLLVHIVSFSLSLILLPALLITTITRISLPRIVRYSSLITTIIGVASGSALLLTSPSGAYCAVLFSYVVIFAGLYIKAGATQSTRIKAPVTIDR